MRHDRPPGADGATKPDAAPARHGAERRLTANLHLYWQSLKTDREPPKLVNFSPATIPTLWPSCLLVIREDPSAPPQIGDAGSLLLADCPALHRGAETSEVPDGYLASQALACLEGAFADRSHTRSEGRFRHARDGEMLYRAIGLPFLDPQGDLTYAVCAASGKKS